MSFNSNKPYVAYVVASGVTDFPFDFKIFVKNDLAVYYTEPAANQPTKLSLGVDYSLTISGDNGGTLTLLMTPVDGSDLVMQRELDIVRLADYQISGDLRAETLNNDQDYQTYLIADLLTALGEAVHMPPGYANFSGLLPVPVANTYVKWDPTATRLINGVIDTQDLGLEWATVADLEAGTASTKMISPVVLRQWMAANPPEELGC